MILPRLRKGFESHYKAGTVSSLLNGWDLV